MQDEERTVKLTPNDSDTQLSVPMKVAKLSKLVSGMIGDDNMDDDDDDDNTDLVIPLPSVDMETLQKVVEFSQHYLESPFPEIPKPIQTLTFSEVVPDWYANFCASMDLNAIYDTLMAANYMDLEPLLDLMCAKLGILLKIDGVSAAEIRATFAEPAAEVAAAATESGEPSNTDAVTEEATDGETAKESSDAAAGAAE